VVGGVGLHSGSVFIGRPPDPDPIHRSVLAPGRGCARSEQRERARSGGWGGGVRAGLATEEKHVHGATRSHCPPVPEQSSAGSPTTTSATRPSCPAPVARPRCRTPAQSTAPPTLFGSLPAATCRGPRDDDATCDLAPTAHSPCSSRRPRRRSSRASNWLTWACTSSVTRSSCASAA
jgi:hypothetical protein